MLTIPSETALPGINRAHLRIHEAVYFLDEFKKHCGSPASRHDSSFHWLAYSDAFLMALLSIQDFIGPKKRAKLLQGYEEAKKRKGIKLKHYSPNPLLVLKLMRNRTVHHCVLAAPGQGAGKGSVSRIINLNVGGQKPGRWVEPRMLISQIEALIRSAQRDYRKTRKNNPRKDVKETRIFIKRLIDAGKDDIKLADLFQQGLEEVATVCNFPPSP
jgi:hypothetical protein